MSYRKATVADLVSIEGMLKDNNLPYIDCIDHIDNFIIKENNRKVIGLGGIEIYGSNALIRSIVVTKNQRGKGIAKDIFKIIKENACSLGVNKIYLLTETAMDYFEKLNFTKVNRTEVPESIMNTKQFKTLCPSSAIVMRLRT